MKRVLIVGGGMMGSGIAAVAAHAGNRVAIVEPFAPARERILSRIHAVTDELLANEMIEEEQVEGLDERIEILEDLSQVNQDVQLIIEAITENLALKQEIFAKLDAMFPVSVPIASNTSGLRITDISKNVQHKERTITTHFWFPAHLVPLVEVVMSEWTNETIAREVYSELKTWGKAPVLVRQDLPGQLANRILQAVIREASSIVELGIASPEDVDTAIKMGMGLRFPVWGPLEHVAAVGVDLCTSVQDTVLPGICKSTKAADIFREKLAAGELGYKSGKGFYDWSKKDMKALERLRNAFIMQSVKFIRDYDGK